VEEPLGPFEKTGRVVTPCHRQWKEAGDVLAKLLDQRPDLRSKLPALVNNCLLALSARAIGATLYSRNRDDFMMLCEKCAPFRLSHQRGSPHNFVPRIVPTTIQNNQINPTESKISTGEQKGSGVANKGVIGFGPMFSEAEGRWFEPSRAYF